MRYDLVLFDFDGTLADSFGAFLAIVNQLAQTHRFRRIEGGEVELLRTLDARSIVRHLGIPLWKLPGIAREMRRRMAGEIDRVPLFPGIAELLRHLTGQGITLAIVTSNSEANVRRALGPENAALIRYWECGTSVFGKRSRLRRILRRSGTLPARAILIGDEVRDLVAARAEGIAFGAVTWGYNRPEALAARAPDALFTSAREIARAVVP